MPFIARCSLRGWLACCGIYSLRASLQGFLDQRSTNAAVRSGDENCFVCDRAGCAHDLSRLFDVGPKAGVVSACIGRRVFATPVLIISASVELTSPRSTSTNHF